MAEYRYYLEKTNGKIRYTHIIHLRIYMTVPDITSFSDEDCTRLAQFVWNNKMGDFRKELKKYKGTLKFHQGYLEITSYYKKRLNKRGTNMGIIMKNLCSVGLDGRFKPTPDKLFTERNGLKITREFIDEILDIAVKHKFGWFRSYLALCLWLKEKETTKE